jgi:elongation factor G
MEAYLEGEEPSEEDAEEADPQGHDRLAFNPVLCGTAFKNKGVQPLLDAVVDFLPSPVECRRSRASTPRPKSRWSAKRPTTSLLGLLAFKIMNDPFVGSLTFCRIYSGTLTTGLPCSTP